MKLGKITNNEYWANEWKKALPNGTLVEILNGDGANYYVIKTIIERELPDGWKSTSFNVGKNSITLLN